MKKICAVTMARNDDFFLSKWIDYYGRELGYENLYILLDGKDQNIPANAGAANVTLCEHVECGRAEGDKRRINMLSDLAAGLLERYDLVIGTDADEFLVIDPLTGKSLAEYLSTAKCEPSVSGLGVDVGQHLKTEKEIDGNIPFLTQRDYALLSTRYTKSAVISEPVRWGSGFHRVMKHNFRIDRNLYLFHFGSVDMEIIRKKSGDQERVDAGWSGHMKRRARTILLVSGRKACEGDTMFSIARRIQTFVRPPYALNKPAMFGWKLVVRIPERFKNIV